MDTEKKNLPMKPIDRKEPNQIQREAQSAGQLQAFAFISNIVQVQIAYKLIELHDSKYYKQLGYKNWDEVCEAYNIKKGLSYQLMKNLKIAGPAVVELMYRADFTTYEQYLMLKGEGGIEDAEFEVLSDDEIKVNGKRLSVRDNSEEVLEYFCKLKHERDTERRARADTARELEEKKEEVEKFRQAVREGEKQYAQLQKQLSGPPLQEATPMSRALMQLVDYANQVCAIEMTEADEKDYARHIRFLENKVWVPLIAKFNPRREDLSDYVEEKDQINIYDENDIRNQEIEDDDQ